ncbi:hypothetical protein [Tessaracoccus sp. MC1756]|uniref:hypothetical protein n=1 Tax=Tessaracoccus sp. MC1756 TaxID=2760311 RepID=UPI0016027211|nr:hypothetical protein [Tessaracoccus sp. MC1756]MBB1509665.1 hypothetical protein [Tessaracoccus sp. MC1756]
MPERKHAAILRWLASSGVTDITLSCQESSLPGSVVLDRCLTEVPFAWLVELAVHCRLHLAVDHCEHSAEATKRFANLAVLTHRIRLDGGPGAGAQVFYASPPATDPDDLPAGATAVLAPRGTYAERLAVALASLPEPSPVHLC